MPILCLLFSHTPQLSPVPDTEGVPVRSQSPRAAEEDEQMKASALFGAGWERDSVEVLWQDAGRAFCRLGHDGPTGDRHAFIPILSGSQHPTLQSLTRLTREYELKDSLAADWALRPVELVRERGRTMLVVEYVGGEPLDRLVGEPMEIERFLRLAVALCAAIGGLHGRGLIHKDIKPRNVIVDSAAGQVWLTGFGIASLLPRERQALEPPEIIAGTLAYMAPEQTGRMNRSVDTRSDLYALGVTLYQLVTGGLPFTATDPMELVHCHIARQAVPPAEQTPGVPAAVSAIVMKLLDPGRSISNRCRCRRRPGTLPDVVSAGRQHRALCAGGARHS